VALPCLRYRNNSARRFPLSYPSTPTTIGEHIRKKRMDLGLLQTDVAQQLYVSADCVSYWENNRSTPQINYYPSIISFLGYSPFEIKTNTLSEKIVAYRCLNGLSYKAFGRLLGVDASTIRCWEIGRGTPNKEKIKKLEVLLTTKPLD